MRFFHVVLTLSVLCVFAGFAATPSKSTSAKKVTTKKKAASSKAASKKSTSSTAKTASAKSKSVKGKSTKKVTPAATWRTRQQNPTPDRYKEIQQALVDKGYLKSEPTGVWDNDSVEAMSRFQVDQKMTPTGKINAPSLIGLGLGAKSAGAPEAKPLNTTAPASSAVPPPTADPPSATPPPDR